MSRKGGYRGRRDELRRREGALDRHPEPGRGGLARSRRSALAGLEGAGNRSPGHCGENDGGLEGTFTGSRADPRPLGHGLLEIGLGNYESAVANLLPVYEEDLTYLGCWSLPDLVEAASSTGNDDLAQLALDRLSERAVTSGTDWALGLLARSRALLARDGDTEVNFQQAVDRLQAADIPTDLARAYLLFGEWLRSRATSHDARHAASKSPGNIPIHGSRDLCGTSTSGARCQPGPRIPASNTTAAKN